MGFQSIWLGIRKKILNIKKEKGGSVTFRDNVLAKIVGKGTVSLGNNKTKV